VSRYVYTWDGRRLYTTAQLAAELDVTPEAIRKQLQRQKIEPYTRLDGRTPLWTLPVPEQSGGDSGKTTVFEGSQQGP
jgi:hypothetical protein